MPQIRDAHDHVWVVTEHVEIDWSEPTVGLRELDDLSYATLSFKTLDGRESRMLRHVAPLDWRACDDEHLLEWLQMAEVAPPRTN